MNWHRYLDTRISIGAAIIGYMLAAQTPQSPRPRPQAPAAPIVASPVVPVPYVATSGKTIGVRFQKADGTFATPTAATAAPMVARNGQPVGPLVAPWITGYHTAALWGLPPGVRIDPADVVTISAPAGWAATSAGPAAALDSAPVDVRAGRSAVIPAGTVPTLKPGWNNAHLGSQNGGMYSVPKNWRYRCDTFGADVTYDPNGKPIGWPRGTKIESIFYRVGPQSGVDQTINFPSGLWALGWDDPDPANPTACSIVTAGTKILSIVERPELSNPGVNGVGIVKVYQIDQLATTPQDSTYNATANLYLRIVNATKAFKYDKLVIHGPGDFAVSAGVPTVLDRTDPYAISQVYLDRLREGAGSLRWVDSLWGFGGISQATQPEQAFRSTDFTWGLWQARVDKSPTWTTARPWDPSVTPYIYTTLFGDPFPATLAAPIDAAATVLSVPDAATAPVIVGLRLKAGDELMRVLAIDGTNVTVERGSCSTTAAPHEAGPIAVQNRWPASGTAIPQGQVLELVSDRPHGVETGEALVAAGPWPQMVLTDGARPLGGAIANYPNLHCVTGPNTALIVLSATEKPWVTLAQSYALPAGCKSVLAGSPAPPAIPVEFAARVTSAVGADFHVNVPHAASDSLVDQIAVWARDNTTPGRKIFVEYSNEPWNYGFNNYVMMSRFSSWLEPGTGDWGWYCRRSTQVWTRFRDRFGPRAGEIVGLLNSNKWDATGAAAHLEFCHKLGVPAGVVGIAPYTAMDAGPATQAAFWGFDDEQAIDLYSHDLWYNTKQNPSLLAAMGAVVAAYNTKYGEHVSLYGYEGGIRCAAPPLTTAIPGGLDGLAASFPVASGVGLVPGTPVLCDSEWMAVSAVAGNTLTVARGQYGTAAAVHNPGAKVRTAYLERSHDLIYNPNWYFAEHDFYGLLQQAGFSRINSYALSMGASEPDSTYGAYHIQTQRPGRGDGSDGLADNRLTLATPGKPYSKAPTTNQDAACVSVRGRAFLDWMRAVRQSEQAAALQSAVDLFRQKVRSLRADLDALDAQAKAMQAAPAH